MIQVEPCTLPPGFVAWRDGINEQWAECPWQAAALAARSDPMSERVTQEQVENDTNWLRCRDKQSRMIANRYDTLAAERNEQAKKLDAAIEDVSHLTVKCHHAESERDHWQARAERAEQQLAAANAERERLRGVVVDAFHDGYVEGYSDCEAELVDDAEMAWIRSPIQAALAASEQAGEVG